jgi:hypothetical protein
VASLGGKRAQVQNPVVLRFSPEAVPVLAEGERALRTQASSMLAVDFFHVDCAVTLRRDTATPLRRVRT